MAAPAVATWPVAEPLEPAHPDGLTPPVDSRDESAGCSSAMALPLQPAALRFDDPLVGRLIDGRYRVVEPLGHGGMGRVYRAVQVGLDREVALKVLAEGHADPRDLTFVKRFCLEASVTARLGHPNTVVIHDYGRSDDGIFYIAMEYLEGRTLAEVLEAEGALPPSRVLRIGTQIARAAREAHRNGLVHRDLKPSNVMLVARDDEPDFVKVLDFGLAKFFVRGDAELTQSGAFLGSPQYMAPELLRNAPASPRTDIYGLGVVLYEMACGRPPFTAASSIAVLLEHASAQPKRPRLLDSHIPEALEHVILRAIAKDPQARYGSMDELLLALSWAGNALGVPADAEPLRPVLTAADVASIEVGSRRRYWRRKLRPWLVGLAAAAGAGAAAWQLLP